MIQKNQWFRWIDAEPLQARRRPIAVNMVDTHKPSVLRIGQRQTPICVLVTRMRAGHVVRNRLQMARLGQIEGALFLGDDVPSQQQPPIFHAMDGFGHLALAAAARALVHEDEPVLIRRHHRNRRAVIRRPAFALALVEQHRVDALLRARPGIEVIRKDLLVRLAPIVHHNLPPSEMRMPERRRNEKHSTGDLEVRRHLAARNHALQIRKGRREKRSLPRHNQQTAVPQRVGTRVERHRHNLLRLQPRQRLQPHGRELLAKAIVIRRLVRRQRIANDHSVWIAPAHRRIRKIDRDTVPRLGHHSFHNAPYTRRLKNRLVLPMIVAIAVSPVRIPGRPPQRPVQKLWPRLRRLHQRRRAQHLTHRFRQRQLSPC